LDCRKEAKMSAGQIMRSTQHGLPMEQDTAGYLVCLRWVDKRLKTLSQLHAIARVMPISCDLNLVVI
jgi:hypothetical protein